MSANELIAKATEGKLSPQELNDVVQGLVAGRFDPYDALLIIGRAGAKQHRRLVEHYLLASDDPMLARLAIQVLCRYWGLATEYQDALEQFVRKVDWDEDDDVRLMAIDCAGSLLAERKDRGLLALLLQTFRDDGERQIVREAAYCALALAAGKHPNELPAASRHFDLDRDIDRSVISRIEATVRANGTA